MGDDHQLTDVLIGDDPTAWTAAGFSVTADGDGPKVTIGKTAIRLVGSSGRRGIHSIAIDGLGGDLDGISVSAGSATEPAPAHSNGIDRWDHLVVMTPDSDRTTQAYEAAGIGPDDLDLVELHDCFATAELVHYDNLMLCEQGGAVDFFESGAPWRDGRMPVNVSGGLQSKGHPISATGIANIWEVAQHVRGEGGPRQIEWAKVGLAHVIGLGSACGVHILEKSGLVAA